MESIRDNQQILNTYVEQGWKLVPIDKEKRHPNRKGWEKTDFFIDQILKGTDRGHGVGIQTGPVSSGLVVVDLDSHYARVCGPDFLPPTQELGKEGEADGLSSLWLYYSGAARKITIKPLNDKAVKGAVVELLGAPAGQGRQFIVPPSTHPKKGAYQWIEGFDPQRIPTIDAADLETRVRRLGAAALIAEHLPRGGRHNLSLALAGYMLRHEETVETVESILASAWKAHSGDVDAAVDNARDTAAAYVAGGKVTGGTEVNKTVPGLAGKLAATLGWKAQHRVLTPEEKRALAEKAWGDCKELATSENILAEVYALQQRDGLVGEEKNAKIMQLVAATRHKGRPMSAIVNGESSGGKSFLLKETAKTLPEDAVHTLQSISDKALAYIGENTLTDKFLLIYELGGVGKDGAEGLEMVKQLLTEGRIDRQIAESTPKGVRGRRVYAEGPTGLWTTTTKASIDRELQNRALTLTIDESPEQTERIIKGRRNRKKKNRGDFAAVKALHTWLAGHPGDVDVPFEDVIADRVDTRAVRMRRFYDYVMELVEAHALLHRANRVTVDGVVLARPEDYAAVYALVKDIVSVAAESTISDTLRQTVEGSKKVWEDYNTLTSSKLADELRISRSTASRRLKAATEEGYIKQDPAGGTRTKMYVLGDISLPDSERPAIPDPEDIAEAMRAAYDEVCKCANCARTPTPPGADGGLSVLNCAEADCTLDAHIATAESPPPLNPHAYGESDNGTSGESADPGPSVHTLHTCTDDENESENGAVHASVQGPLHTSERPSPGGRYEEFPDAVKDYYWSKRDAGCNHAEALQRAASFEDIRNGG